MDRSQQLREIIAAGGFTQEALARRLNVSFVTINAWLNGRTTPRAASRSAIEQLHAEIVGAPRVAPDAVARAVHAAETIRFKTAPLLRDPRLIDILTLHLTYHTNSIEGSTMTLADTHDVLFENRALASRTQVEQAEARNHQAALLWLLAQLASADFTFTEDLITSLHLRLMNGLAHDAGAWRTHSARIAGSRVVLANPLKVPSLMQQLIENLESADRGAWALATLHARFELIHPFSDGNGRVGRLIMLAMALCTNMPPPIIQRERRQAYYRYLEIAQLTHDVEPLTYFIAESILAAHNLLQTS